MTIKARLAATGQILWIGAICMVLAGCGSTKPDPELSPVDNAWAICIDAHQPIDTYAAEDGTGTVTQTDYEACARWMVKVGEATFIEQWTPEYAETYKAAFG